jgi:2'-5' RNA ligase
LPDAAKEQLDRIQRRLIARLATDGIRWTPRSGMHLTLKFLGDVDQARIPELSAAFRGACNGARALRLGLGTLGCFPTFSKPNVIWVGLTGDVQRLKALYLPLDSAAAPFAEKEEHRPFQPHLTLGRVRPGARGKARRFGELLRTETISVDGEWICDTVTLYKSELMPKGSIHTPLERVNLPEA